MENYSSPLQKYKREPKLYVDLPSGGKFYPQGTLVKSEELEVYSISASDEIRLKTPDALYTGQVIPELIQKNMPAIKNAWMMPVIDLEFCVAAIRLASYTETVEFNISCPKCQNADVYGFKLQAMLDHFSQSVFQDDILIDGFRFRTRPLTYKEDTEFNKINFKLQRTIIQHIPKLEQEKQEEELDKIYDQVNDLLENIICTTVTEVTTPDGEQETQPQFIRDFILNSSDKKFYNELSNVYEKNKKSFSVPKSKVVCANEECKHEYETGITLDYSNFFDKG